jgi:hypothetical protein
MNVSYQFEKIRLLLTENRLVTVLEKVSMPAMAAIELCCKSGQQFTHDGGNWNAARLEQ